MEQAKPRILRWSASVDVGSDMSEAINYQVSACHDGSNSQACNSEWKLKHSPPIDKIYLIITMDVREQLIFIENF